MPSVWIERRTAGGDRSRYLVKYRLGGRECAHRYAGSFVTRREALARQRWVAGELAAMRVPRVGRLTCREPRRRRSLRLRNAGAHPASTSPTKQRSVIASSSTVCSRSADQVEAVLPLMPRAYALAVLVLDATGMRVGELEEKGLCRGDLDEPNSRWRIRRAVEKGRRGRWVSLPPDLFTAVIATLPPREDRPPDQPVFPKVTQERLRTAIARACRHPARRRGHRTTSATAGSASGIGKARRGP